jgi:hypothetical protein
MRTPLLLAVAILWSGGCMEACTGTPPQPFEVLAIRAPGEGGAGVFTNTALLLELAQAVEPSSVTEASAYLAETDATGVETGVRVEVSRVVPEAGPRFVVLDPVADLRGSTGYVARLTSAVTSLEGKTLPDYAHPFTTAPAGDQVFHPVVSSSSPAEGETIGCTDLVTVRFGAGTPVDPRTIDAASVKLTAAGSDVVYRVEYSPAWLTLRPVFQWTPGAAHTLTLDGNRIRNLWGQTLLAGSGTALELHFTAATQCGS